MKIVVLILAGLLVGGCDTEASLTASGPLTFDAKTLSAEQLKMLELVNKTRAGVQLCGIYGEMGPVPPLVWDVRLAASARETVEAMYNGDFFAHTDPVSGERAIDRIQHYGPFRAQFWGENLHGGYIDLERSMAALMASEHHCTNIMEPDYTRLGWYWQPTPGHDYSNLGAQHFASARRR